MVGKPTKRYAVQRIQSLVDQINELQSRPYDSSDFQKWARSTDLALRNTFGDQHRNVDEFSSISYSPIMVIAGTGDYQFQEPYTAGLKRAKALLYSMIEEIQEYWSDDGSFKDLDLQTESEDMIKISTKSIFVIHGHDELAKESVARYISNLGFDPVILHEQGSCSLSMIEKFERHSEACFAIALLTPDDVGGTVGNTQLKPRARQNVIFELGYFIGKLSRTRVCALTKGDIELPSDYKGVAFVHMDPAGAWRMQLVREMKASGLEVDANRAF